MPGGAPLACVWGVRDWALSDARPPVLGACGRGPLPTGCGCGGCWRGDPSPTPQRALLRAGFVRCGGGTRAPRGGGLLPVCGASGVGRSPTPNHLSLGRSAAARYPLAVGAVCGRGGPAVLRASWLHGTRWPLWLGTCPPAVVVASGVPLWRALWPRVGVPCLVRFGRSR